MTASIRDAINDDIPAIFEVRTSVRENQLSVEQLAEMGITFETIREELGDGVLRSEIVTVRRRYGHRVELADPDLDYRKAVANLLDRFELDEEEREEIGDVGTSSDLVKALAALEQPSSRQKVLAAHLEAKGIVRLQIEQIVLGRMPKFMYFSSYDRMEGVVQIEQAASLIADDRIAGDEFRGVRLFTEFLDYAGVSMSEITQVSTYETFNARLQAASNNITDQILAYWTQNPDLNVMVRIEQARTGDPAPFDKGTIARARVENQLHRVDTRFSERSAGFVWFFSFLVKFAQVTRRLRSRFDDGCCADIVSSPGRLDRWKCSSPIAGFHADEVRSSQLRPLPS